MRKDHVFGALGFGDRELRCLFEKIHEGIPLPLQQVSEIPRVDMQVPAFVQGNEKIGLCNSLSGHFLEDLEPAPKTDLAQAVASFTAKQRTKGFLVVVSDFWDEQGYERALKAAYGAGFDLAVVCVHHEFEAEPKWRGTVVMTDVESARRRQVTISSRTLGRYRREYAVYQERLRAACLSLRSHYVYAQTSIPFEDLILKFFRLGMFVK